MRRLLGRPSLGKPWYSNGIRWEFGKRPLWRQTRLALTGGRSAPDHARTRPAAGPPWPTQELPHRGQHSSACRLRCPASPADAADRPRLGVGRARRPGGARGCPPRYPHRPRRRRQNPPRRAGGRARGPRLCRRRGLRPARRGARSRPRPAGDRSDARVASLGRSPAPREAAGRPARARGAARARQPRAGRRRRARPGRPPDRLPGSDDPGHESRGAPGAGRARVSRAAAGRAPRRSPALAARAGGTWRCRPLCPPCPGRSARLRPLGGERGRGRRDLRAAGRFASRHRARGGPHQRAAARCVARPTGPPVARPRPRRPRLPPGSKP